MATLSDLINNGLANDRVLLGNALFSVALQNGIWRTLYCTFADGTAKGTFRIPGSSTSSGGGYKPGSNKRFLGLCLVGGATTAAPAGPTYLGPTDNDVGETASTALTNQQILLVCPATHFPLNGRQETAMFTYFPGDKYISLNGSPGTSSFNSALLIGLEQDTL